MESILLHRDGNGNFRRSTLPGLNEERWIAIREDVYKNVCQRLEVVEFKLEMVETKVKINNSLINTSN
jgi:hypothetical protein